MKGTIRDFPSEMLAAPWPVLVPTLVDKQYQPIAETPEQLTQRTRPAPAPSSLSLVNVLQGMLKGALLGSMAFALIFGIVLHISLWFLNWHWAFTIVGAALLLFLFGVRQATLLILSILFMITIPSLITDREILFLGGLFLCSSMIVRGFIECLPLRVTS
jgi:hypothetical protein